ncbi:FAD-binding oxidoreductase [Aestuariivirga litoralis]|uniref:FAD-binding oxidoreductase n=1 Tax=Aestuariivirga litoralis TaxID=2650924 RepID=A0A2W2B4U8_9HYPH|nr:FAD-binding oxidoreductase [Aestuariivirga litoralis]PZF75108.1 FAD-binding oxidoreductase [Aestuariivirga litoralis]
MSLLADLRAALGDAAVLEGEAMGAKSSSDMSLTGTSPPRALLRPRTTEEVATALRLCNAAGVPVIAQGGMTGLAGGANPTGSEIAISLELIRGIEEVDTASATMVVKAGTPLEDCQRAAADAGLFLALDLGSRGSCTVGGNLSTNAGGIRVIRYGMAREQVLGLEAVLADGTVISSMNRMLKNNAGYDLKHLFIGSEGTLGLITRAVLRLHPPPGEITTMLCAVESYDHVVALLRRAQGTLGGIVAFEAMWRDYFQFNADALKLRFFEADHPFWVIIESTMAAGAIEAFLAAALEEGLIADALIAQSHAQSRQIWSVRDGHPIEALPNLLNFDVSLPIGAIGDYAVACTAALKQRWPEAHVSFYGHVGDSNVHICVSTLYRPGEDMHSVDDIVYGVLGRYHGSISAEHGIGTLKRPYLHLSRSPAELALMRTLKQALDPRGILNPGKVV